MGWLGVGRGVPVCGMQRKALISLELQKSGEQSKPGWRLDEGKGNDHHSEGTVTRLSGCLQEI